jgi:hypothetical protein
MRSARSASVRRPGAPDSAPVGARLCPRLQALRGGRVPPSHRRAASGRVPGSPRTAFTLCALFVRLRGCRRSRCSIPWAAAAAGDGAAGHLPRALVTEICGLRASPCVRVGDAQDGALRLVDLLPAVVANQNGFPSHAIASKIRFPPEFTQRYGRREFARSEAGSAWRAPRGPVRHHARRPRANAGAENPRSSDRPDIARLRPG